MNQSVKMARKAIIIAVSEYNDKQLTTSDFCRNDTVNEFEICFYLFNIIGRSVISME